ncbi:MAG: DUF29 domain-containing protein [Coleofasciculaceae cyanobacterium SM2_1_6]|nr:DUF29 domain-containing protein [Coleofasciculaceae cyanobacterium SM2_1_6]
MEELIKLEAGQESNCVGVEVSDDNLDLYETDFYQWTQVQAKLLSQGQWTALDIENLVEEIESLGKQQKQELRNRLGVLIGHLLKWEYQPELRGKSWKATIWEQREQVLDILQDNPSLKPYLEEAVQKGFRQGLSLVLRETPLDFDVLPKECPYTIAQVLDPQFPTGMGL